MLQPELKCRHDEGKSLTCALHPDDQDGGGLEV